MVRRYCTMARLARITISASTTINSMMVKPRLPVLILRAIERRSSRRRVHVEHILATPRRRIRVVLIRSLAPLRRLGHRVDRNPPEELDLAAGDIVGCRHSLDQRLEGLRVAFAAGLDLEWRNLPEIGSV